MGESETPGRLRGRPILWFALPMAVLVFVGASTPWIAQRVPRFLFPALAAAGAVLVVFLFVNSLVQFVRRHRGEGPNFIGEPSGTRTLANPIKSQETPS